MKLRVKPIYGWRWFDENTHSVTVPEPFQLAAAITESGEPFRSALGFLEQPKHPLSGFWIALTQRHALSCNLLAYSLKPDAASTQAQPKITGFADVEIIA